MNNLNKSSSYKGHLGYYYFYLSLKRWPSSLKYSLNLYQKRINMVRDTPLTAYQQTYSRGIAQHLFVIFIVISTTFSILFHLFIILLLFTNLTNVIVSI